MARVVSTNLATILAGPRKIDYVLTLTFSDASVLRYATSNLNIGGNDYANSIENVREIRQTLETVPDRVGIELQNKDRVLSQHLATNWQKWRTCVAVLQRYYQGGVNFATTEMVELFRGGVQQPNADDLQFTFDILHHTLTPGKIVSSATLNPLCQNVFKDPKTCGYAGAETVCDHHLKSKTGCDGFGNSHRFRGMEHRYPPDVAAPGSAGNSTGPHYCPTLDQWTMIERIDGMRMAQQVGQLKLTDKLWNPKLRKFVPIRSLTVIPKQPIAELIASNGAVGYSSFSHPVIQGWDDNAGKAVEDLVTHDLLLTEEQSNNRSAFVLLARPCEDTADVMLIELDGSMEDKIYLYGNSPEKLIWCHNAKPAPID